MASIKIEGLPEAAPVEEPWPMDDDPIGIQADEMFARQLDAGFAGEIRALVHDPETGLAGKDPEDALGGVAEAIPMLGELKDRYLAQAIGPRQRTILAPLIDSRLDRATGDLGRIAQQATSALDDRIVAERIADLQQEAVLAWHDPAHLGLLGRAAVGELRYQGERRGWDETQTVTTVRGGLSDLYAGAVEQAIGQDPDGAAKLYEHARDVIQPERQAAVERKIERVREERRVTEIVGSLSEVSDDPTHRPDLDGYQARAAELTPPDASPEVRAQMNRMVRIEHAQADRAWQAERGRAALAAVDWLGKNPAARLLAMPPELRDGLSPKQTEALDQAAINGGRMVTDRDLYEALDGQVVHEPEAFAAIDLAQHRLSLGDHDYQRLVGFQKALMEGKSDAAFERHSLGRTFLGEGLSKANVNPDGPEARTSRRQLDRVLGAFETIEGKPPTMADIRSLVGDVLRPLADDPNIVRVADNESAGVDGDVQVAQQQEAQNRPSARQPTSSPPASPAQEPGRGYGKRPQAEIEKGMTRDQVKINRDQAFRELMRQPLDPKDAGNALPDGWEKTKPADLVDEIKRAADRHGVPIQLLARLLFQEGKFNEPDKLKKPLVMESSNPKTPIGYAQMTGETFEDLKRRARERGDKDRAKELAGYSLANREQSFDAAAEQLAYLHRLTGGSWPKAVAGYNYGPGIRQWFDGQNVAISTKKWEELKGYLPFALKGAAEDPQTADGYAERLPNQGRTRDRLYRPNVPSDTRQNP